MTPEILAAAHLLAKYAKEAEELKSENDRLRAALKGLVELKEIKDKWESLSVVERGMNHNIIEDYRPRKRLAWEAANKLLNQEI